MLFLALSWSIMTIMRTIAEILEITGHIHINKEYNFSSIPSIIMGVVTSILWVIFYYLS